MGDKVAIAVIPPDCLTSKGGLIAPENSLRYIDPKHAAGRAESRAQAMGFDSVEELEDTSNGYFEWRHNVSEYLYAVGVVIGENVTPKNSVVEFGDVVLFEQAASVDFTAFDKLPNVTCCGRTEVYLCDSQNKRWIRVPLNAEVVFCPADKIDFRLLDFAAVATPQESV